jgi:Zn-dependent protease
VHIHPTFWIFLIFFTNIYRDLSIHSCILGVVLILSLLVHEYGHALTALFFGARPTITLEAFGGQAQYNGYGMTRKQQFLITLNGPLLESLLIVVSYGLLKCDLFENSYVRFFLYATMRLNILWCLFNLIPMAPLDGGHLLRYLLENRFGQKGYRASVIIGLLCAAIAVPYLFYQGLYFFAGLLLIFALQHLQILKTAAPPSRSETPFNAYMKSQDAIKNNDLSRAKDILKRLLKSKDASIKCSATESLAKLYDLENQSDKSYELLLRAEHRTLKEGKKLLCRLAYERKNYELVGKYSRDIYAIDPSFETALLNSQAFAQLNQPALSGAWLYTASQFGDHTQPIIADLLKHPAYDLVRDQDAFKSHC